MVSKIGIAAVVVLAALLVAPSASFAANKASNVGTRDCRDVNRCPGYQGGSAYYRSTHHKTTKQHKSEPKS
jgi:hypothetical protein